MVKTRRRNKNIRPYSDRKVVYVFQSPHGTTSVVNYDYKNEAVNTLLSYFDIWGGKGELKQGIEENGRYNEMWFECPRDFLEVIQSNSFLNTLNRLGVNVGTTYPFSAGFTPVKKS